MQLIQNVCSRCIHMKSNFILALLSLLLVSTIFVSTVESKSTFDYEIIFRAGNLYCLFDFPREAHEGDTYNYELNVTAEANVSITTFEMNVFYWDASGEHMQSYNIANYVLLENDENFVRKIQFTVPSTISWHKIYVNFEISTDEVSNYFLGIFTTLIRDKTYSELQSENFDLRYDYSDLESEYENYKVTHNYLNNEYNSLNSSYNSLESSYNSLQDDYNQLESNYQEFGEPVFLRNLMFAFLATTIIFITTTIYFAVRRPKVKLPASS